MWSSSRHQPHSYQLVHSGFQVDANPSTRWLYKELSQELKQLSQLYPAVLGRPGGTGSAQHCQLLLLQAEAHQHLAREPGAADRLAIRRSHIVCMTYYATPDEVLLHA